MRAALVFVLIGASILCPAFVCGQARDEAVASFISSVYSPRTFTAVPVEAADVATILRCGIKAPSARNGQPWHFTVVRDASIMRNLMPDATEGNVLIVVSSNRDDPGAYLDCGLATENIFLSAQALGYGSHIYTGPVAKLNQNYRAAIGIPAGYSAVSIVRIGSIDKKPDSLSSASSRKPESDLAN